MLLRKDADGDGHPDAVMPLITGLKRPLGMDFAGDYLYIAESNRIGGSRSTVKEALWPAPTSRWWKA